MQNFISSSDLLCWNIVLKGNNAKSMTTNKDDEHMGDFYHMIDARDMWNAIKARFSGNADTTGSSQGKLSYQESENGSYAGYTTTLSASPGSSSSKGSLKSKCSVVVDKYKEAGKDGTDSKAMVVVDGSINWDKQTEEDNTEPRSLENFGMVAGLEIASDADSEGEVVSADDAIPAGDVVAAVVSPHSETEFALMGLSTEVSILVTCPLCCDSKYKLIEKDYQGQREQLNDCVVDLKAHKHAVKTLEKQIKCHQTNRLAYKEKIKVLSYDLEEKSNILEYRQKLIDQTEQEKHELMTKLNNEISNQAKWNNSGKNLYKLIDSSMSVRTKQGLGLDKYIGEGELGIDDSKFSIFNTNNDELEGQPINNRFASVDHMKAVPPLLTGNYMPPSNIPNIDESQMVYGKKTTDSFEIKTTDDSIIHTNDPVLFDFNDRSSEPSTNDLKIYLHLIKDCDLHEQRLVKRNAEGKGKLGRRPTGKPVNLNRPKPVSACQPNPVFAGKATLACNSIPLSVSAAGSESHPPMLNKENYVPWSSRLLRYAKSRPNGKLVHKSILNGPYVRKIIPEPGDANREITVIETFHLQTDDELSEKELKQIKADDQAIQTIFLDLPEDIYEKKAKLFNEWEMFTSNEGESIESYYHRFLKLMNDLKRNKHFPEKIASNLKFLNNLQPKWSRHVTIVHQTKDLHTADYTQLYDFLKYNQKEYAFPAPHQDQPSFNQNYLQQPMPNPEDITDPTTAMNMALALMAKAFKLNYSTSTNNNQRISSNPRNRHIAQPGMNMGQDRQMQMVRGNGGNQFRQYVGHNVGNPAGYNDVIGSQVIQNAVQNPRVQNVGNPNGLIGVQG
nr:hypothetical protein [Tanacetum cinerariifolium]